MEKSPSGGSRIRTVISGLPTNVYSRRRYLCTRPDSSRISEIRCTWKFFTRVPSAVSLHSTSARSETSVSIDFKQMHFHVLYDDVGTGGFSAKLKTSRTAIKTECLQHTHIYVYRTISRITGIIQQITNL